MPDLAYIEEHKQPDKRVLCWLYKLEGSKAVRVNEELLSKAKVKELAKEEGLIVVSQKKASEILTERKQHENSSPNS